MEIKDLLAASLQTDKVLGAMKYINGLTASSLKYLWSGKRNKRWEDLSFFLPKALISLPILAIGVIANTVVGTVGAITSGIIGGGLQILNGILKVLAGAYSFDIKKITNGLKDITKGIAKVAIGSTITAAVGFAAASIIGAPAIAAISTASSAIPLTIAGQSASSITAMATPVITAAHSGLTAALPAITSALATAGTAFINSLPAIVTASWIGSLSILAGISKLFKKLKNKVSNSSESPNTHNFNKRLSDVGENIQHSKVHPEVSSTLASNSCSEENKTAIIKFFEAKKPDNTILERQPNNPNNPNNIICTIKDNDHTILANITPNAIECPAPRVTQTKTKQLDLFIAFLEKNKNSESPIKISHFPPKDLKELLQRMKNKNITVKLELQTDKRTYGKGVEYTTSEKKEIDKLIKKHNTESDKNKISNNTTAKPKLQ